MGGCPVKHLTEPADSTGHSYTPQRAAGTVADFLMSVPAQGPTAILLRCVARSVAAFASCEGTWKRKIVRATFAIGESVILDVFNRGVRKYVSASCPGALRLHAGSHFGMTFADGSQIGVGRFAWKRTMKTKS
eukprot:8502763-Pyramimonas_sp.AAC.1